MTVLKAPFPWFGGKSRAAPLIWEALGDVANYVEPFCGSLATVLGRPHAPRIEIVNDKDAFVANFWRAVSQAPDLVAEFADWPVNEADLLARHRWLVGQRATRDQIRGDPNFYDARIAGWWAWGISQWIGDGWCSAIAENREGPSADSDVPSKRLGALRGNGVHAKRPSVDPGFSKGVHSKKPDVGHPGHGREPLARGPFAVHEKKPDVDPRGDNLCRRGGLVEWFGALQGRLRLVRVLCGDWERALTPCVLGDRRPIGVVLDPPYAADERNMLYSEDDGQISVRVREWALDHGADDSLRIALCGYEGEHEMPSSWRVTEWKAQGGYGREESGGAANRHRERIWFSPGCLASKQGRLFS